MKLESLVPEFPFQAACLFDLPDVIERPLHVIDDGDRREEEDQKSHGSEGRHAGVLDEAHDGRDDQIDGLLRMNVDREALCGRLSLDSDAPVVLFIGTLFDFSGLDGFIRELSLKPLKRVPPV